MCIFFSFLFYENTIRRRKITEFSVYICVVYKVSVARIRFENDCISCAVLLPPIKLVEVSKFPVKEKNVFYENLSVQSDGTYYDVVTLYGRNGNV